MRLRAGVLFALVCGLTRVLCAETTERSTGPKKERRVFTNDDLAQTKGRIANDPSIPPAAPLSGNAEPERHGAVLGMPAAPRNDLSSGSMDAKKAFWTAEARRRRDAVAAAEADVARTDRWRDPTYAGQDRPSCPIVIRNRGGRARARLAAARAELAELEEDARKAGALPGWVR